MPTPTHNAPTATKTARAQSRETAQRAGRWVVGWGGVHTARGADIASDVWEPLVREALALVEAHAIGALSPDEQDVLDRLRSAVGDGCLTEP